MRGFSRGFVARGEDAALNRRTREQKLMVLRVRSPRNGQAPFTAF